MNPSLERVTLITGGARSGKSRHALALLEGDRSVTYIATAEALDDDMRGRIARHRSERKAEWATVEAPLALPAALRSCPPESSVLVDCLTLWVSNLLLGPGAGHQDSWYPTDEVEDLVAALADRRRPVVLVTNEVGSGVVPPTALGGVYRDALGRVNQRLAEVAGRVVLVVAGIPLVIKGECES
jgi:adenosylcobinamide kinase/adenosylcobinamide-phosphate guanylyltransferase